MARYIPIVAALFLFFCGCPAASNGYLEGSVAPPGPSINIAVSDYDGNKIATLSPDVRSGRFRVAIAPGTYAVSVQSPAYPFPVVLSAVIVRPGETTTLDAIQLGPPPEATASIRGRVRAAVPDAVITLLSDGIERASVRADGKGNFLIERLLPGSYELQVRSPGYANDALQIVLLDGQHLEQDIRQLYVTSIEGIDWNGGVLRARGIGLPPAQPPNPVVRREMAKRAAVADAERNLLRAIELIQVGPDQKLSQLLGEKVFTQHLQGFLSGYRIAADRDLDGGKVEIEIEMPLTGPHGITARLHGR